MGWCCVAVVICIALYPYALICFFVWVVIYILDVGSMYDIFLLKALVGACSIGRGFGRKRFARSSLYTSCSDSTIDTVDVIKAQYSNKGRSSMLKKSSGAEVMRASKSSKLNYRPTKAPPCAAHSQHRFHLISIFGMV